MGSEKRTHRMGEEIGMHLSDKRIISRTCVELLKINHGKIVKRIQQ